MPFGDKWKWIDFLVPVKDCSDSRCFRDIYGIGYVCAPLLPHCHVQREVSALARRADRGDAKVSDRGTSSGCTGSLPLFCDFFRMTSHLM